MDIRIFVKQLFNRRVRLFAVRTLQITELNDLHWRICRTLRRARRLLLQFQPGFFKWLAAKRENFAYNRVLSILADIEFLRALTLRPADLNCDFCESFRLARLDAHNFPCELGVVTKSLVHERVDNVFRRKVGGSLSGNRVSLRS